MKKFKDFKITIRETLTKVLNPNYILDESNEHIAIYKNHKAKDKKMASLVFVKEGNNIIMYKSINGNLIKSSIDNIDKMKTYIKIIKELINAEQFNINLILNIFDLHTFLADIKKEFNIEINSIDIYRGVNKGDIKKFQIEYFGNAKLEDVVSFAIKYLKDKIDVPLEIRF